MNRELVERCNRMEYPLRSFIDHTLGELRVLPALKYDRAGRGEQSVIDVVYLPDEDDRPEANYLAVG